jgi:Putative restriction endonuclease
MQATLPSNMTAGLAAVSVRYAVRSAPEAWVLPEGLVPESIPHQAAAERLKLLLDAWSARTERNVRIASNLAVRFLENTPSVGIDPDVCVLEPPPPNADDLSSLCLWKPGHVAPPLCFEIVSASHPYKDYATIQDRYAALGTRELCVFDPLLAGPVALGGPVALQMWRRDAMGLFERVHFSDEPAYSVGLEAWLHPAGRMLEIADDPQGRHRWPSGEERERAEKERERAEKERERAEKERERAEKERERAEKERERAAREALERRVAELEVHAARGGSGSRD